MGTTQQMGRFIVSSQYEDIPGRAVDMAKLSLLDAVGCAIYGTTRPLGKIMTSLTDELGGKPVARVLGTHIETNAVNAALANGTLGHSEDFDDMGSGAHQTVLLMPVVLALGEELHASGKQVLTSYLVFALKDANLFNDKASKAFCRDEDFRETVAYRRYGQVLPSWRGVERKSSFPIAPDLRRINIFREAKSQCTISALRRCLRGVT